MPVWNLPWLGQKSIYHSVPIFQPWEKVRRSPSHLRNHKRLSKTHGPLNFWESLKNQFSMECESRSCLCPPHNISKANQSMYCIMEINVPINVSFVIMIILSSGASACVELNQFEEAIMWCAKGLAVSFIAWHQRLCYESNDSGWLVLTNDPLENRCTDDIMNIFCLFLYIISNR